MSAVSKGNRAVFANPLKEMRLTQPYGVNWVGSGFYKNAYDPHGHVAADGRNVPDFHDGFDLKATAGTPLYAVMSGDAKFEEDPEGGNRLVIRNKDLGLEVIYGHIMGPVRADGPIHAGEAAAFVGSSGKYSTGPHLHLGVRNMAFDASGAGPFYPDLDNGYGGFIDPGQFFPQNIWYDDKRTEFMRPVDGGYGFSQKNKEIPSEREMAHKVAEVQKALGRTLGDREYNALRFGMWDLPTVLDPAMYDTWSMMSKPEAQKRGIVK